MQRTMIVGDRKPGGYTYGGFSTSNGTSSLQSIGVRTSWRSK